MDTYSQLRNLYRNSGFSAGGNSEENDDTAFMAKRLGGSIVENKEGRVIKISSVMDSDESHGNFDLNPILENAYASGDRFSMFKLLFGDCGTDVPEPGDLAFIDTETTGLQGGAGTMAFQIGIGAFKDGRFMVNQYFCPSFEHESAMLFQFNSDLADYDYVVTYNGKCFDIPLIENRCILNRIPPVISGKTHLDMLFPARRLWKAGWGDCSLNSLEKSILGFYRTGDIPGSEIPREYFNFLHSRNPAAIKLVLTHNRFDILSLAGLYFHAVDLGRSPVRRVLTAEECYSLGMIHLRAKDHDAALIEFEECLRIMGAGEPASDSAHVVNGSVWTSRNSIYFDTLRLMGMVLKRRANWNEALACYLKALEEGGDPVFFGIEAAKILEHRFGDYANALDYAESALLHAGNRPEAGRNSDNSPQSIERRKKRLLNRISKLRIR